MLYIRVTRELHLNVLQHRRDALGSLWLYGSSDPYVAYVSVASLQVKALGSLRLYGSSDPYMVFDSVAFLQVKSLGSLGLYVSCDPYKCYVSLVIRTLDLQKNESLRVDASMQTNAHDKAGSPHSQC